MLLLGEFDVPRPRADAALRYAQPLRDETNREALVATQPPCLLALDQFYERMFARGSDGENYTLRRSGPHGVAVSTRGFHPRSGSSTLPGGIANDGPPGTRTQNHGINLPHRLSPASGAEAPALRSGPSLHPRPDRSGGRRMASEGSPAEAGLPADRPIPGGFHRDGYSGALRGSQQIAADEPAISRLALLS